MWAFGRSQGLGFSQRQTHFKYQKLQETSEASSALSAIHKTRPTWPTPRHDILKAIIFGHADFSNSYLCRKWLLSTMSPPRKWFFAGLFNRMSVWWWERCLGSLSGPFNFLKPVFLGKTTSHLMSFIFVERLGTSKEKDPIG